MVALVAIVSYYKFQLVFFDNIAEVKQERGTDESKGVNLARAILTEFWKRL